MMDGFKALLVFKARGARICIVGVWCETVCGGGKCIVDGLKGSGGFFKDGGGGSEGGS